MIDENYNAILAKMAKAAKISGRKADDTTLIAISKTRHADEILPLLQLGHRHFGENRVQEAEEKWPALKEQFPDITLHMVGQLQSNKADNAVQLFDSIHSLDRPSLAKALAKAFDKAGRQLPCFVQVNIGDEEQKGGCPIAELPAFLQQCRDMDLPVKGLMCVPPAHVEPSPYFALLAKLARDHDVPILSMGMSGDFETAVTLGANFIRVGSAIFGEREKK